jgi:hypothetical protein
MSGELRWGAIQWTRRKATGSERSRGEGVDVFVPPLAKIRSVIIRRWRRWSRMNAERRWPPIILRRRGESRWGGMQWRRKEATGSKPIRQGRRCVSFPLLQKNRRVIIRRWQDGAKRMWRGECRPSSRGVGANRDGGRYSGRGGK